MYIGDTYAACCAGSYEDFHRRFGAEESPERIIASLTDGAVVDFDRRLVFLKGRGFLSSEQTVVEGRADGQVTRCSLAVNASAVCGLTMPRPNGNTSTEPRRIPVSVRFDDGQLVTVPTELVVGRNPHRHVGEQSFDAAIVRSPQVSRTHWLLSVNGDLVTIRDLHSTAGTEIEDPGGRSARVPSSFELVVERGCRVLFGDRWAVVQ